MGVNFLHEKVDEITFALKQENESVGILLLDYFQNPNSGFGI